MDISCRRSGSLRSQTFGAFTWSCFYPEYVAPNRTPSSFQTHYGVRLGERNEVTFKRLVVEGERRYLKPLNQNWPDKFISLPSDARIVGVVVGRYTDP